MTTPDFEQILHTHGYTTHRRTQGCMGSSARGYEDYTRNLVDVLRGGVVIATYDEVVIRILFTPENIHNEIAWLERKK